MEELIAKPSLKYLVKTPQVSDEEITWALSLLAKVKETKIYAFDVEHNPAHTINSPLFEMWGVSFYSGGIHRFVRNFYLAKMICMELAELDKSPDGPLEAIAYNGKYDIKVIKTLKWYPEYYYPLKLCDPMVAVNLLDDNRHPNQLGLDVVVLELYNFQMEHFEDAAIGGPDSERFKTYANNDVIYEHKLWLDLKPKLEMQGLSKVFHKVLGEVAKPFADMELAGIQWDLKEAKRLLFGFTTKADELEREIIGEIGALNINSGDQVAKRLFDELGYSTRGLTMTPSGSRFKVDGPAMEILAQKYPICKKIVLFKTCKKMVSTYIEPLTRAALDDPNGRIHPTIWIVSTTGRSRMEKPNFQNIPAYLDDEFKHLNIRKCVIPRAGFKYVSADLSQIELRICAHIAQEPIFLKAYQDWQCTNCGNIGTSENEILHKCPICGCNENEKILKDPKVKGFWHGLDLHRITADSIPVLGGDRQKGKKSNFSLIYVAGGKRMNFEFPELSIEQWEEAIEGFMKKYPGIRRWHDACENTMRATGVAIDVFGRRRRILKRDLKLHYKHCLNQFVNFPVQSSACALIELSMVKMREQWVQENVWEKDVFLTNFVHDELCFEVRETKLDYILPTIRDKMENSVKFRVPLRTDIKIVNNWMEAKL